MENTDNTETSGLSVPDVDEDSVDIYAGLDMEFISSAEKSPPIPPQLKDSMDLYEEMVTEEQQSRESSYTELTSRFKAAQNHIKELRRRLEQVEIQNTGLNTENYRLKKNISALLRTARQEVMRKDAEIQRLNQRSGGHHHHHHPSRINNLRDQTSSNRTPTGTSRPPPPPSGAPPPSNALPPPPPSGARPPPPPSGARPPLPPTSAPPPLPPSSAPPLPPSGALPPRPPSGAPPPRPPSGAPPPRPPSSPALLRPPKDSQPPKDLQPPRKASDGSTNHHSGSCSETRASKASSHSHSKRSSRGEHQGTEKQTELSSSKSSISSSSRHCETNKHTTKHREEKYQAQKLSESTEKRSRSGSDPPRDCYAPEKNMSHKSDKEPGRRYDSRSCKSRNYKNADGHHRPARSPLPEILHVADSSDDSKGRCRERRQNKSDTATLKSENGSAHNSTEGSRHHRKVKSSDNREGRSSGSKERKRSSSNQHYERYSDSAKQTDLERSSKDHHRNEGRRCEEDGSTRKHKKITGSETSRGARKQPSKDSQHIKVDVQSKDSQEKTHTDVETSSKQQNTGQPAVEENSPNRKLCFMETLNLTLSPIKKPSLPRAAGQEDLPPGDKLLMKEPDGEDQSDVEDMCVIDEVNCSELEDITELHTESPKTADSEKLHLKSDEEKDVQEEDKGLGEHPAADKQQEGGSVQAASADPAENQVAGSLTPTSPVKGSLMETDGDIEDSHKDQTRQEDVCGQPDVADGLSDVSGSLDEPHTPRSFQKVNPGCDAAPPKPAELSSTVSETAAPPGITLDAAASQTPAPEDITGKDRAGSQRTSPAVPRQDCQDVLCPPSSSSTLDGLRDTDAVSSTISLESLPQEGLSLPEAIYVLTQTKEDVNDSSDIPADNISSTGCIGVSKVSSTTEETTLPEKYRDLTFTPKKSLHPGKGHVEPSSSMPLLYDEDSMMRTLSNLKRIPDAISPLRSPIRVTKRSHLHVHCKPGHVKSLQKEFTSPAADSNSKKLDVNKENKYPGSPVKHDLQDNLAEKLSDTPSSLSDAELEDGEILSESEEAALSSPVSVSKRVKLSRSVRNKPTPQSLLKRKSEGSPAASKEPSETATASTRSPANRSRFKTVCPASTKASFSNVEEVMETFKMVRSEIRKKYMKLHKSFPKKSFYGVMENFRESFLGFVDGAQLGEICSQAGELKSKLKILILSVFSKVANNGIVKRIFEQQAVDLKQKLWDFVDVQIEYLFKDINVTLMSLCRPPEDKSSSGKEKLSKLPPAKKTAAQQKATTSAHSSVSPIRPGAAAPYRTGLGSRGKDIRITNVEKEKVAAPHTTNLPTPGGVVDLLSPRKPSLTEKNNIASLVVAQNGSLLDRTDFELLTEQQASSLTFNLVRDSQMGEIFKCLLQGSDLLESSGITGDSTAWSLSTPKKDGERLIGISTPTRLDSPSKLLSPNKFETPSKLIATWSSISPRKMLSPRCKDHVRLNPALLDESCLLEVPSDSRSMLQSSLSTQRTYSLLAEDLAVSLTIPSPLKSDSHLSFLQPSSMRLMSTPDSVISAHISEDALLDGEDASEQDIHLALDTDNSSFGSSSSVASQGAASSFVFKPDLPVQALVMERSNDHFILKIRQSTPETNVTLTEDASFSQTLIETDHGDEDAATQGGQTRLVLLNKTTEDPGPSSPIQSEDSEQSGIRPAALQDFCLTEEILTLNKEKSHKTDPCSSEGRSSSWTAPPSNHRSHNVHQSSDLVEKISQADVREAVTLTTPEGRRRNHHREEDEPPEHGSSKSLPESQGMISPAVGTGSGDPPAAENSSKESISHHLESPRDDVEVSESDRSLTIAEDGKKDCKRGRKRKKHREKSKTKRPRREEEMMTDSKKEDDDESKSSPVSLSPNSLSARNVVKKKGSVVLAWTRDEDRAILVDLKTKGASRETFSSLSDRLSKPSEQIAQRFYQLMRLFKKQEKTDA